MPQTISKIGIKNSSGTGYDTRDIGAKGQNVEVGYDASGKIILDVDTQTPATTKQLTKVLQDAENNISNLNKNKAPNNHAWSDADSGVNHGLADGTHYGHIKVGNGLTVNSGKVDVAYGTSANTACQGNDSRLSNARKNPNAVTFSDGTTNTSYDGSSAKTVTAATVGAAPAGHTSVNATSSILGHVKTGTGITNNSGTISVSYGTAAGTACQGNDSRLSDARTPKSHAATTTTYGGGTSSNFGHVKLTDIYSVVTPNASTNGAATSIAASAYALQQAYSTLNSNLKIENITSKCVIQDRITEANILKYGKIVRLFFQVSCRGDIMLAITGLPYCVNKYFVSSIYNNEPPYAPKQSSAWVIGNHLDIYTREMLTDAYASFSYICEEY